MYVCMDYVCRNLVNILNPSTFSLRVKDKISGVLRRKSLPMYPNNVQKYSRRFEHTKTFNITRNTSISASVEGDVIFETDHVVPTTMMMKYALQAMGQDWGSIEVRLHNCDK